MHAHTCPHTHVRVYAHAPSDTCICIRYTAKTHSRCGQQWLSPRGGSEGLRIRRGRTLTFTPSASNLVMWVTGAGITIPSFHQKMVSEKMLFTALEETILTPKLRTQERNSGHPRRPPAAPRSRVLTAPVWSSFGTATRPTPTAAREVGTDITPIVQMRKTERTSGVTGQGHRGLPKERSALKLRR